MSLPFTHQRTQILRQNLLQARQQQNQMNTATRAYNQRHINSQQAVGNVLKAALKRDKQSGVLPLSQRRRIDTQMMQKAHKFQKNWDQRYQKAHNQRLKRMGIKAGLLSAAGASLAGVLSGKKKQQKGQGRKTHVKR